MLGLFLDAVSGSSDPVGVTLQKMQDDWLQQREAAAEFDWRYYMVKYRAMRAGASGLYYAHGRRMGFSLTNLPGGKKYRNANFHDPYLLAIYRAAGEPDELQRPAVLRVRVGSAVAASHCEQGRNPMCPCGLRAARPHR